MTRYRSHPSRVRGLKYLVVTPMVEIAKVAAFTGAWIEITRHGWRQRKKMVAPFTGAWIEIIYPMS